MEKYASRAALYSPSWNEWEIQPIVPCAQLISIELFAIQHSPEPIFFFEEGRISFMNFAASAFGTHDGNTVEKQTLLSFLSSCFGSPIEDWMDKVIQGGQVQNLRLKAATSMLMFDVFCYPMEGNRAVCYLRNIERDYLEKHERHAAEAFYYCPISQGIMELDENDRITFIVTNNNFQRHPEFTTGQNSNTEMAPERVQIWLEQMKKSASTNSVVHFGIKTETHLFNNLLNPINERRFSFVTRDASVQRQREDDILRFKEELEIQIKKRTEELENAMHIKTRFLAIMSHEIRTPLAGVMGMMGLLQDACSAYPSDIIDMIRTAQVCGEQLMIVINDILDLSKMEENKMTLERAPFSLHNVIEDSLEVISFQSEKKNLELICDIDPRLQDYVLGDSTRVRQILVNLLGNAVKFSEKGEIVVGATSRDINICDGSSESNHCEVLFYCKDQGIGISSSNIERLFKPFSQGDNSITRRYGGSGLGLSISKKLSELMGGTMYCESKEGEGSTFYFTIIVEKHVETIASPIPSISHAHKSVAIIESNERQRQVLSRTISHWGFSVSCYSSVTECVTASESSSETKYHIILVDSTQPTDVLITLRKYSARIAITGHKHVSERKNAEFLFVRKPFRHAALRKHLFGRDAFRFSASRSPTVSVASPKNLKILVAEDNEMNQRVIEMMLERMGCKEITVVANGLLAFEAVKNNVYDVVLMDLMMPEMSGLESTERIRKELPAKHQPRIIALTANAFLEDRQTCIEVGMNAVLTKPINRATLAETLFGPGQNNDT
eukprot:TRINITY_DN5546_c0_g1_i1.p1 TRINITY_DN5546_c0_g1~~TRINITY_DN5546_c0_g1_i1.p1  ORF type:complete len:784 (+),score=195.74 TRINITY_DN5546_c0_g1_i1:182-2533(+)